MGHEEIQSGSEPIFPEFNTVDEFMARLEEADEQVEIGIDEEARKVLGNTQSDKTARGRVQKLADALKNNPGGNFYTDLPLIDLRTDRDQPLAEYERMRALAVNEQVLAALYEEAEVDYRQRQLEDSDYHGYTLREIIYPTDKGYAFVEEWQYEYQAEPNTAVPIRLNVYVYTWRDGQRAGEEYLSPTDSEVKA